MKESLIKLQIEILEQQIKVLKSKMIPDAKKKLSEFKKMSEDLNIYDALIVSNRTCL